MRTLLWLSVILVPALAAASARASVCDDAVSANRTARPRWRVDHYVYDASLKRDWEVLVDCDHPDAPDRMELAPKGPRQPILSTVRVAARVAQNPEPAKPVARNPRQPPMVMKAGTAVEVCSAPNAPASILLSGTALETAFPGQSIRVRLGATGRLIRGIVRGPHSVELAAAAKAPWGKP